MNRILQKTLVLGLVVLSASACTRRVQVESEPSRYEAPAPDADTVETTTPRS